MKNITKELFDSLLRLYETEVWLELYTAHIQRLPEDVAKKHSPVLRIQYLPGAARPIRMVPKSEGLILCGVSFNMTSYDLIVPWTSILTMIVGTHEAPEAVFHFVENARSIMKNSHGAGEPEPKPGLRAIRGGAK
jgi:hypothetical protein